MSSRHPPQGPPPSYALTNRIYRHNLRPVVIAVTMLAGLWALFSSIGFFRSISIDREDSVSKLATFAIALGAMYATIFAFQVFGFGSAITQRVPLVRIYTFLALASAIIMAAAGLTEVVVHFTAKDDIIKVCTDLSANQTIAIYPFGFWGPVHHDIITKDEAASWCNSAWNHDSWADIVSFIITMIIAGFFTVIAFAYYRQLLDPSSAVNSSRVPTSGFAAPSHYNPPYYNTSVPNLSYGYSGSAQQGYYAPPPGPPPNFEGKPPDYSGGGVALRGAEKADDPFADFESGPSRQEERDITSRPAPGGREIF